MWDFSGDKKFNLCEVVVGKFFDFEVCVGGFIFVDIIWVGWDKFFGIVKLFEIMGLFKMDVLFYGDCFDEYGNDYFVKVMGILCVVVDDW